MTVCIEVELTQTRLACEVYSVLWLIKQKHFIDVETIKGAMSQILE